MGPGDAGRGQRWNSGGAKVDPKPNVDPPSRDETKRKQKDESSDFCCCFAM